MNAIISFFQEGGAFMYPIAAIMAVGLAIAIERMIFLSKEKRSNRQTFEEILPMLQKRDFRGALNYANSSDSKMGHIFSTAISRMPSSSRREDIELAMEEGLMEAIPQDRKSTRLNSSHVRISYAVFC